MPWKGYACQDFTMYGRVGGLTTPVLQQRFKLLSYVVLARQWQPRNYSVPSPKCTPVLSIYKSFRKCHTGLNPSPVTFAGSSFIVCYDSPLLEVLKCAPECLFDEFQYHVYWSFPGNSTKYQTGLNRWYQCVVTILTNSAPKCSQHLKCCAYGVDHMPRSNLAGLFRRYQSTCNNRKFAENGLKRTTIVDEAENGHSV